MQNAASRTRWLYLGGLADNREDRQPNAAQSIWVTSMILRPRGRWRRSVVEQFGVVNVAVDVVVKNFRSSSLTA